jgi:hypothetical protein
MPGFVGPVGVDNLRTFQPQSLNIISPLAMKGILPISEEAVILFGALPGRKKDVIH